MLRNMARQISPEYGYLDPPPVREHLHEAMRRSLLEEIVRMTLKGEEIPLEVGNLRPLRPKEDPSESVRASQLQVEDDG